jgi:hypothetical protein
VSVSAGFRFYTPIMRTVLIAGQGLCAYWAMGLVIKLLYKRLGVALRPVLQAVSGLAERPWSPVPRPHLGGVGHLHLSQQAEPPLASSGILLPWSPAAPAVMFSLLRSAGPTVAGPGAFLSTPAL